MSEKPTKQQPSGKKNKDVASVIAGIYNVSPAFVRMVMNGERNNEEIFTACMMYQQENC